MIVFELGDKVLPKDCPEGFAMGHVIAIKDDEVWVDFHGEEEDAIFLYSSDELQLGE